MDEEEANDTNQPSFVPYKTYANLRRKCDQKEDDCRALRNKIRYIKKNSLRK
jgi:hypothetical protein